MTNLKPSFPNLNPLPFFGFEQPQSIDCMHWHYLLSTERLGKAKPLEDEGFTRTAFQRDYDRILFSDHFRCLQNKTQVLPLPEADFVHTRLTHTLETSAVGRSLGNLAGQMLAGRFPELAKNPEQLGAELGHLIGAACMAHDIGNPPFGHFGEEAIGAFFVQKQKMGALTAMNEAQAADLCNFEGNAAGFHLLTHHAPQVSTNRGGLQLTAASLMAFTKYPKPSIPNLRQLGKASQKKYGYFQADRETFAEVARRLNIDALQHTPYGARYPRHPLAYLVEAADDICYNIIDLEDAFKLGWVSWAQFLEYLEPLLPAFKTRATYQGLHDNIEKAGYLRALAINHLVKECAGFFMDVEQEILNDQFDAPLIDHIAYREAVKALKSFSVKTIYRSEPILQLELKGYRVLHGLLEAFWTALDEPDHPYHKKLLSLLPVPYQHLPALSGYPRFLGLAMFVSSLSDKYAVYLSHKINGHT